MNHRTPTETDHFSRREPGDVVLMLTGDINIQGREDPVGAFRHVMPLLHGADVLFGQFECPLVDAKGDLAAPPIPHKAKWVHSETRVAEALVAARFSAVSIASNVMYPRAAAISTAAALDAVGIGHCGAGSNLAEARKPTIIEKAGVRFGFLAYTSIFWLYDHAATASLGGCATIKAHTAYEPDRRALEMPGAPPIIATWPDAAELSSMEDDVRRLRREVDVLIVSCHWGVSSSANTIDYQRTIARAAVAAGADVVFGHHPHVVQGIEMIGGKPIFYSLGNFAFDWASMRDRHREGIVVEMLIRGGKPAAWRCAMVQRDSQNDVAQLEGGSEDGRALASELGRLSRHLGTDLTVTGDWIVPAQASITVNHPSVPGRLPS
jgi:poly-gamma-glutamate synthesis protein (capsule biosynthesis protein)